jgi:hypothetical protein
MKLSYSKLLPSNMWAATLNIGAHSCPFVILEALLALMLKEPAESLRRKVCLQACSEPCKKAKILAMRGGRDGDPMANELPRLVAILFCIGGNLSLSLF